jgi:crossover junction endodeoxyribonuclease RusA
MIAVTLPWPSAKLNPNRSKGLHWGATSALGKQARDGATLLTKGAMQGQAVGPGAIALTIRCIQPDRRARDCDNLLAALKPSLDGVADSLGVNDARFDSVTLWREYGGKPGSVRIEIGGAR